MKQIKRSTRRLQYLSAAMLAFLLMGFFLNTVTTTFAEARQPVQGVEQDGEDSETNPDNGAFAGNWGRTDEVIYGGVARTWLWGPEPFATTVENYGKDGSTRLVQYYDKSRMEINNPDGDKSSQWFVSNGLLAKELITGEMQLDDQTTSQFEPSLIPVAGDSDDPTSPTYASFKNLISTFPGINTASKAVNNPVNSRLDRAGTITSGNEGQQYNVRNGYFEPLTSHNIAGPFWDFLNATGTVKGKNGRVTTERLFDPLYFATGLPISEAYWVKAKVGGQIKDVLVQAFERRVLTYTPSNPKNWQVEMGNIGRHYFQWRYYECPKLRFDNRYGIIFTSNPSADAIKLQLEELGGKRPWYTYDNSGASSQNIRQQSKLIKVGSGYMGDNKLRDLVNSSPKGSSYIIGNEPNVPGQDDILPADYARKYESIKNIIKGIDPTAVIVAPNILNWDYTCTGCPGYTKGVDWVTDMLKAYHDQTGKDFDADVWGIHTYGINWRKLPMVDYRKDIDQIKALRKFLDNLPSQKKKPIWITEFGCLWGYNKANFYTDENGNTRVKPAGKYQHLAVLKYIVGYTGWLEDNADKYNIKRWYIYTGYGTPEPYADAYAGINTFTGISPEARLTEYGLAYRLLSSYFSWD